MAIIRIIMLFLLLPGCHVTQIRVSGKIDTIKPTGKADKSRWEDFFALGLAPNSYADGNVPCQKLDGVAFVETKRSALNILAKVGSIVAFGIIAGPVLSYAPSTTNVYCVENQKIKIPPEQ